MKASVCLATYCKGKYLDRVLASIVCQRPGFDFEVIVADDGTPGDENREICARHGVKYLRRERKAGYCNPSIARNMALKEAMGEVIICQSDDVEHKGEAIKGLLQQLKPRKEVVFATVENRNWDGSVAEKPLPTLVSPKVPRPLLFLGAVSRHDVYAIGGNEERFVAPGYDDDFFTDCLIKGRGLKPKFLSEVVGWHLHHDRPANLAALVEPSKLLYRELTAECSRTGKWVASGGQWPTIPQEIAFFWAGRMSWLRWLTLASFRRHNPDWAIRLYYPTAPCGGKSWKTAEDSDSYTGPDYWDRLAELDVSCHHWQPLRPNLPAAHACDLFQWEHLARHGGFYADMDILWTGPLEPTRRSLGACDAMFAMEAGKTAIGFLASLAPSPLFEDVHRRSKKDAGTQYQYYGTELLERMFKRDKGPPAGEAVLKTIRREYPQLEVKESASTAVYPFDWRQLSEIFEQCHPLPIESIGLHWFGGSAEARRWNCRIREGDELPRTTLGEAITRSLAPARPPF